MTTAIATRPDLVLAGPLGSLDHYIQTVNATPVLSAEQEQALARRLRADGDLDAARELIVAHLRFVVHIARGYTLLFLNNSIRGSLGLVLLVQLLDQLGDLFRRDIANPRSDLAGCQRFVRIGSSHEQDRLQD